MVRTLTRQYGRELAEDAVVDAYIKCVDRPCPDGDPGAYFRTSVRTCAVDLVQKEQRQRETARSCEPPTWRHNRTIVIDETEPELLLMDAKKGGRELVKVQCKCGVWFKPYKGKRTCGAPKCVAAARGGERERICPGCQRPFRRNSAFRTCGKDTCVKRARDDHKRRAA